MLIPRDDVLLDDRAHKPLLRTKESTNRSMEAGFSASSSRVAKRMEWPEYEWTLLIQQVISGKAQSAVSALRYDQAFDYWTIKDAILH